MVSMVQAQGEVTKLTPFSLNLNIVALICLIPSLTAGKMVMKKNKAWFEK